MTIKRILNFILEMRIDKILLVFVMFSLSLFSYEKPKIYVRYVDQIRAEYEKEMKKKYKLQCIGGGGGFFKDVEEVAVLFAFYEKASIEKSREMAVLAAEPLLEKINQKEQLRPYLREYPFTANGLHLTITFFNENNQYQIKDSVTHLSIIKNNVYYERYNPETEKFEKLLIEPYEEARDLVLGKSD